MKLFFTLFRALIGATMFAHGAQKLFGWFGGYGPDATGQAFEGLGMKPGKRFAVIAGASEVGGGALLATGLLTPVGSAAVIGVMRQAIESVHKEKGFFVTEGGFEYNLAIIASAVAIADLGPGPISLDHALGIEAKGTLVALAALGAGLAGPQLVAARLGRQEEPQTDPMTAQAGPGAEAQAGTAAASS
jgi:putative oxidoreductase